MEDLAGMRFKIINQMVKTFIQQEKKFFETCYFLINNFYKGMGIMEQGLPYQKSSYDPMKYIRANKIMEGVDVNSLPNIKMKDKYSSNNFKIVVICQLIIIMKIIIKNIVLKIIN